MFPRIQDIWGYTGLVYLVPFNKMVTIVVAFFFFLSGYGLMRSFERKEHYLQKIVFEKVPFLSYMALMTYLVSGILELIISVFQQTERLYYYPYRLTWFLVSTNWYVYELIGFYILFVLIMHFLKEKWCIVAMAVITICAFFILFYSGLGEAYYNSIFGFTMGMFCYRFSVFEWTRNNKYGCVIAFMMLVSAFCAMFILDRNTVLFAMIRNLAAIASILVIFYILPHINFVCKTNILLSKLSPELYFYHMPICLLFSRVITGRCVYIIVVVLLSFSVTIIMNYFDTKVQKMIKREK